MNINPEYQHWLRNMFEKSINTREVVFNTPAITKSVPTLENWIDSEKKKFLDSKRGSYI